MSDLPCTNCGFEIGLLQMELPSSRQEARRARQDLVVHCPLCGQDHPGLLKTLGFFWRESEEKYRYWIEGSSTAGETSRKSNSVPIGTSGKLTLRFDKPAEPLGKTDILYSAVPLFEVGNGVQEPTLPVREEYLDCLDEEALFDVRRDQPPPGSPKPPGWRFGQLQKVANRTTYVSLIPYRGVPREKWETVPRPIVPSRSTRDDKPVFPGVFVRHWPNVDIESWRFHLVSFGVTQRAADALLKDWTWRVKALVPPLLPADRWTASHVEDETAGMRVVTVPIDLTQGRVFTVSCDGTRRDGREDRNRPAWIAVQVDGPEGSGGGLFALPPARQVAPQGYTLTFGLDFGTSNTVLATAYEPDGQVRTVSPDPHRTTRYIVGEGVWDDPYDLWPGGAWLGPHHDLLPSELYSRVPWGELARDTSRITTMTLGVDLGIPLRLWSLGPSLAKGAAERLLVDFKWARAISGRYDTIANQVWMVQSRFLEAAALMAVASRVCDGIAWPEKIAINYSYPPAFSATDRKNLRDAVTDAARRVTTHLGLRDPSENQKAVQFEPGPDEAQAAVMGPLPNRMFTVFVDIGGGSLEVLIEDSLAHPENKQGGHEGLQPEVVRNSLYFGGGTYLRALVNGSKTCIDGDYSTLSARVRSFPSGRDFVRAPGLFRSGRVDVARKRARVYGEAIADYVARTLAGMCLEHGFQYLRDGSVPETSRALNLSRNRLFLWNKRTSRWELGEASDASRPDERHVRFTLMLLGNGWNTVEIPIPEGSGQTLESYFGGMVQQRLLQILEHERAAATRITDGRVTLNDVLFEVDCPSIVGTNKDQVLHRKAVVASNLSRRSDAQMVTAPSSSGASSGSTSRSTVAGSNGTARVELRRCSRPTRSKSGRPGPQRPPNRPGCHTPPSLRRPRHRRLARSVADRRRVRRRAALRRGWCGTWPKAAPTLAPSRASRLSSTARCRVDRPTRPGGWRSGVRGSLRGSRSCLCPSSRQSS